MTAGGGNLIGGEISRNKQSPLWGVAPIEAADDSSPWWGAGQSPGVMFFAHNAEALENTKKATDSRWFTISKVP